MYSKPLVKEDLFDLKEKASEIDVSFVALNVAEKMGFVD